MAARKRRRRKPAPAPEIFTPTLLRLHERWTAEQIASVIEAAETQFNKPIARFIVLQLSQMPQKSPAFGPPELIRRVSDDVETEDVQLGICQSCHTYPATAAIMVGPDDVKRVCARCYGEFRNLTVQEGEDDGTRAETGSDPVQT